MAHIIAEGRLTNPMLAWWFTQTGTCVQCGCVFRLTPDDFHVGNWHVATTYAQGPCPYCQYNFARVLNVGSAASADGWSAGFAKAADWWSDAVARGLASVRLAALGDGSVAAFCLDASGLPISNTVAGNTYLLSIFRTPLPAGYDPTTVWTFVAFYSVTGAQGDYGIQKILLTYYFQTLPQGSTTVAEATALDPGLIQFLADNQIPIIP